jgi:pyridine nucleotide-disulfide oxidoreductase family protein
MKRLVLAGGGHAHLAVLKTLAMGRWPGVEVVMVAPYARQIYSGMVPGWMSGHYTLDQCAAALEPLAAAAGVRLLRDSVVGLAAGGRVVITGQSGELAYDALSIDIGAQVNSGGLAGTGASLLPIRPLEDFVVGWQRFLGVAARQRQARLVVVGGGAAGVELALAARYRLARELGEGAAMVSLVAGGGLLPGHGPAIVRRVGAMLVRRGIEVVPGLAAGSPDGLQLDDGRIVPADCIIAATGVRPAPWLADTGLALAGDGFIAVGDGQQSISHPEVFAAGDVASRIDAPHAKSGVYAVRAGPVLSDNLRRALDGQPIRSYQPQKRTLYLLATGPREAIMSWAGLTASGAWVWRWKDAIDRRFMRQYDTGAEAG